MLSCSYSIYAHTNDKCSIPSPVFSILQLICHQHILKETQHAGISCGDIPNTHVTSNWKPIWIFSTAAAGNVLQRNGYLHWTLNQTFVFTLTYMANKSLCVYERRFLRFRRKITFFPSLISYPRLCTALKAGVFFPVPFYFIFSPWQLFTSTRQTVLFNKLCRIAIRTKKEILPSYYFFHFFFYFSLN